MNEIAKVSILDEKTKFTILDEIWTKNGQLIAEKMSNSFTLIDITIIFFHKTSECMNYWDHIVTSIICGILVANAACTIHN